MFGIFQDEFFDTNNANYTKNDIHQPVFIKRDLDSLPENIKALAIYRLNYILWIQSNICGGWTQKNLVPLIEKVKLNSVNRPLATPVRTTAARWGSIPRVYIECTEDRAISISTQRSMYTQVPCERVL